MWAVLGIVIFGLPLGVSLDNIALYLPMGILLGILIGVTMGKKRKKKEDKLIYSAFQFIL